MNPKSIWVLVADEAIARFLRRRGAGEPLEPVEELTDPAAHARGADMRRDAHGRRAGSAPAGSHNGGTGQRLRGEAAATAPAGEDEEHLEAQAFARSVAQRLNEHLQAKRFDELRIAAAPRFLGLLRQALSPQVAACVSNSVSKDLIHLSNRELAERLFDERATARAR